MYVGMRSTYINYNDFKRAVGGAMKVSRACFGSFECILRLAKLNDLDCSG
jgi:hypothetical protein